MSFIKDFAWKKSALIIAWLLFGVVACVGIPQKELRKPEKNELKAAKMNVQLGLAFLESEEMGQAKKKLLQALKQAPNEPVAWCGMAYFLERTGDFSEAERHYRSAIDLKFDEGSTRNNYGSFLCRQKRYQEGLSEFEKAVKDPLYLEPAVAYRNAALCALNIPNQEQAKKYRMEAEKKDPRIDFSFIEQAG